jgi:tetratricopeptide (TPR) repeat protein
MGWQPGRADSHDKIDDAQMTLGDPPAALVSYRARLQITKRLVDADESDTALQQDHAVAHGKLGEALAAQGDPAALTEYRAALTIIERLARADEADIVKQHYLALLLTKIGDVQASQHDISGALASYLAALAVLERLARTDRSAGRQQALVEAYNRVGDVQVAQGDGAAAVASYKSALLIVEGLARSDQGNVQWLRELAVSYSKLSPAFWKAGDADEARKAAATGRAIIAALVEHFPAWAQGQQDLTWFDTLIAKLSTQF